MPVCAEVVTAEVPLDQRRHYLSHMEGTRKLLVAANGVTRFTVLEDRVKLGHFVEIIEYESPESQAALAQDQGFQHRLAEIDRQIEMLLGRKRQRRIMVDRL